MAQAKRDNNFIPTMMGVLNTDGITPTLLKANATDNTLDVSDAATGSDLSGDNAYHDNNYLTTLLAVSEADGVTPVPLYVDSSGNLLIDSN